MNCEYCGRPAGDGRSCTELCERQLHKIEVRGWERMTVGWFDGGPLDGSVTARLIAETVPEANQRVRFEEWVRSRTRRRKRRAG